MIVSARIGDIESAIDTDDQHGYVPEVAGELLTRCTQSVIAMFDHVPDAPVATEADGDS